jgi:hypothetical protein
MATETRTEMSASGRRMTQTDGPCSWFANAIYDQLDLAMILCGADCGRVVER